jgi:NADPH:quinone reductase-like Zn-dependent oxidoreductase
MRGAYRRAHLTSLRDITCGTLMSRYDITTSEGRLMPTARRIQYHEYGGPELMRLEDFDPAPPGKGQVLIRVVAAAANPMDWKIRNGDTKFLTGRRFPRGLGHDFAGTIESVGEDVTRFEVGDAVLGAVSMKASGAFAELVVADATQIVKKPSELAYEQAAVLPTVGVTAWQALIEKGRLRAGQRVFINGCLGGVGRTAAQIAQLHGASVAGSARATTSGNATALGIAPVVDFDFDPTTLKGTFDLVFDTAGTLPIKAARTLLKPGGRIVDINGSPTKMARSIASRDFTVLIAKYKSKDLEQISQAAAHGKLNLPIARTVPLPQAIDALTELENNHTPKGGKLVITLP